VLAKEVLSTPNRTIFASSCSSRHLTNPYAYSKRYGEHLCQIHGNALALRFFNIYGEGAMRGIVKFLCDQPDNSRIIIRGPESVRDYVHVDDVVDYIINCIRPRGRLIDLSDLRKYSENTDTPMKEVLEEALKGKQKHIDLSQMTGIVDVGTGVGTKTIDLVSLYCNFSGKRFEVDTIPPDSSEPLEMVSENIVPHMDLKTGLLKLINNETV
jgi:nucleoside-diphosphate-sugar epimerase